MSHNPAAATALLRSLRDAQRISGYAVTVESAGTRYVHLHADAEWSWTADRHEAELFPSEERATAWAARNIGGGQPKVVPVFRG